MRDVLRITSLSRPTLYRRIAANRFPAPVHLGGRACGWATTELQAWISNPEGYGAAKADNTPTLQKRGRSRRYA
ncbi:MAG: AlpA family phage regulatory protein [Chloroflexota bacterium]|nr:AlpA family phage regulatory protein [Chloroflexota bacterium]